MGLGPEWGLLGRRGAKTQQQEALRPGSVFLEYLQRAALMQCSSSHLLAFASRPGVPCGVLQIRALPLRWHPHRASDVVLCAVKQGTLYGEGTIEGNLPRSRANAVPHQRPISDVDAERIGKRLLRQVAGSA